MKSLCFFTLTCFLVLKKSETFSFQEPHKQSWSPIPVNHHNPYINTRVPPIHTPFSKIRQGLKLETKDKTYSVESNNFHTPIISHHKNGATVGLHLPDTDLRLLLDIDNSNAKPVAQHIGLKVVEVNPVQKYVSPFKKEFDVRNAYRLPHSPIKTSYPMTYDTSPYNQSYREQPYKLSSSKNFKIGYVKASDLHSAIHQKIINQKKPSHHLSSNNINPYLQKNQKNYQPYSYNYHGNSFQTLNSGYQINSKTNERFSPQSQMLISIPKLDAGGFKPLKIYSLNNNNESKDNLKNNLIDNTKNDSKNEKNVTIAGAIKMSEMNMFTNGKTFQKKPLKKPFYAMKQQMVEQVHIEEDMPETTQASKMENETGNNEGEKSSIMEKVTTTEKSIFEKSMDAEIVSEVVDDSEADAVSNEESDDDLSENANVEFNDKPDEEGLNASPASFYDVIEYCAQSCKTLTEQMAKDSKQTSIEQLAASLGANDIISAIPSVRDIIQSIINFAPSGYTLILPSNDAIARLPQTLVNTWLLSPTELKNLLEHHFIENSQTLEEMKKAEIINPRASGATLRVNSFRNETYSINGQRVVFGNQKGPNGGIVHVIDGVLYPYSNKNIMQTLRSCSKCNGFVTLAEGTGLSKLLLMSKYLIAIV